MKSRCNECHGKAHPIAQVCTNFTLIGVEAIYEMECLSCGRKFYGRFFFPLNEENFVGEIDDKEKIIEKMKKEQEALKEFKDEKVIIE